MRTTPRGTKSGLGDAGTEVAQKSKLSSSVSSVSSGFALWRDAMRWQRNVDSALAGMWLTHTQFLVLSTAHALEIATQDAFSQRTLAERAGLDKGTTSRLVRVLESRGLLDRDITFGDERAWRVRVTRKGRSVLREAARRVEGAHERFLAGESSDFWKAR